MNLEELIYSRITTDSIITSGLAKFGSKPAVFEIQAPSDKDHGWNNKRSYPRIVYATDKQENPERNVSGSVIVDIMTRNDTDVGPEVFEERLRYLLSNVFFEPEGQPAIALVWNQTAPFEEDESVIGVTVTFDLFAFPGQSTSDGYDPITGLIAYSKILYPTAHLLDQTPVPPYIWAPTNDAPAIYWRITNVRTELMTNSVTWMIATIQCHVFGPSSQERMRWVRVITEDIANAGWVKLADDSPLIVKSISADSARDPLKDGQITLTATYGIPRIKAPGTSLQHVEYAGAIGG